jgi:glucan phosphorylase
VNVPTIPKILAALVALFTIGAADAHLLEQNRNDITIEQFNQFLTEQWPHVSVAGQVRTVVLRNWRYTITGAEEVPVYLLDADLPDNSAADRRLTDILYGGDEHYRLAQEIILPLFHRNPDGFIDVMRHAIALNGSFFNSYRMLEEYELKAYAA